MAQWCQEPVGKSVWICLTVDRRLQHQPHIAEQLDQLPVIQPVDPRARVDAGLEEDLITVDFADSSHDLLIYENDFCHRVPSIHHLPKSGQVAIGIQDVRAQLLSDDEALSVGDHGHLTQFARGMIGHVVAVGKANQDARLYSG